MGRREDTWEGGRTHRKAGGHMGRRDPAPARAVNAKELRAVLTAPLLSASLPAAACLNVLPHRVFSNIRRASPRLPLALRGR